jgi:hypothetical protein
MKARIIFTLLILGSISNAFAQYAKEVPDYLFAKNANFVVTVISMEDMVPDRSFSYNPWGNSPKTINYDKNLELKFLNTIGEYINNQLKALDLQPQAIIFMDFTKMQSAEELIKIARSFKDAEPEFMINIFISTWGKNLKKFKKNEFDVNKILPISFTVSSLYETELSNIYAIQKSNLSLGKALALFSEKIKEKKEDESYFVDTVENITHFESSPNLGDTILYYKLLNEKLTLTTFPDDSELKNDTVLLLVNYKEGDRHFNSVVEIMEKYYPYAYVAKPQDDWFKELKKDYRFVLTAKHLMKQTTTTSAIPTRGTSTYDSKTENKFFFYYGLKDINDLTMYFGAEEDYLKNRSHEKPADALKSILKRMKEYYGWEKKE